MLVMYILPMILGRTFDARYDRVGVDIFPPSELDKALNNTDYQVYSRYEIIDSQEKVRNLLDISGDLALKIKAGKLDIKGTGTYLKDVSKYTRTIEILTSMKFVTNSITLRNPKPLEGWRLKRPEDLGTHYVRSISYGGELLASLRFKALQDSDFNVIKAAVTGTFSGGNAASLVATGQLEKVQSDLQNKASMEISYYATVPLKGVPNTIDGFRSLVNDFDKHLKEVNNGWGVPVRVELAELSSLEGAGDRFKFLKNSALQGELKLFEEQFDDLRQAQGRLTSWIQSLPASIIVENEKKINALYERINKVLRAFYDVIGKLNVEQDAMQLQTAQNAYKEGKIRANPPKFSKELDVFIRGIDTTVKKLFGTGSGTYVRWGADECPPESPKTAQMNKGHMSISTNLGIGGGSEYLCMPEKPDDAEEPPFGSKSSSYIAGVRYSVLDSTVFNKDEVRNLYGFGAPCSTCHMTNRTLVHMFPGKDLCPDGWITEYSGYLMSGTKLPSIHVCVDEDPKGYDISTDEKNTQSIGLLYMGDGNVAMPDSAKNMAIKCIVCSK